jgi:hypothetical protein
VPYIQSDLSEGCLVIASDQFRERSAFGIQRQVVASKKRDKAGVTVCCRATSGCSALQLLVSPGPGYQVTGFFLEGLVRTPCLAWHWVRPRVGRVGPLRPNWPSSSLYCHNHAFDARRRPSRPSCAASECHCAPLHGRQYMSVYDLARIWSISLYRVCSDTWLVACRPAVCFPAAQFRCAHANS